MNNQGHFHFKYMFCHASTKEKSVISHLMQMPSYPGSHSPPEERKTVSLLSIATPGFHS